MLKRKKKELKEKLDNAVEVKMLLELSSTNTIDVQKTTIDAQAIKLDEYRPDLRKMQKIGRAHV